jgi:hypothetical protein
MKLPDWNKRDDITFSTKTICLVGETFNVRFYLGM